MQHKRLSTDTSSVSARRETDAKHVYSASGPTNVCSNTETDTCLLQVQKIKTKRGTVNVIWDNAASLCFVTNSTAKEQNLKGKKVDLSIIKIGAQDEKINTMKYILPLVDAQGQTVHIEVYGIDQITSSTHAPVFMEDMVTDRAPDTYVIQRVSFGDKPSATTATMALRKTAEMGSEQYPDAAKIVKYNTYMDDIIESTTDLPTVQKWRI